MIRPGVGSSPSRSGRFRFDRFGNGEPLRFMLLAVATGCILMPLLFQPLWHDEGSTFLDIDQSNVSHVLQSMRNYELTPPLYFLIEFGWTRLAGTSEIALRLPSLLALSLAVPLLYDTARVVRDRTAGYATAACAALAPLSLFIGSEARAYALTVFLSALVSRFVASLLCGSTGRGSFAAAGLSLATAALCWTSYTAWPAVLGLIAAAPLLAIVGNARRALLLLLAVTVGAASALVLVPAFFAHASVGIPVQFDAAGTNLLERFATRIVWFSPLLVIAPAFPLFLAGGTLTWLFWRFLAPRAKGFSPEDQFLVVCGGALAFGVGSSAARSVATGHHLAAYAPAAWLIAGSYYSRAFRWLNLPAGLHSASLPRKAGAVCLAGLTMLTILSFPLGYAYEAAPRSGSRAFASEVARLTSGGVTVVAVPDALSPSIYYYLRNQPRVQLNGIPSWKNPWYLAETGTGVSREGPYLALIDSAARRRRVVFAVDWSAENLPATRYDIALAIVRTERAQRGVALERRFPGTVESMDLLLLNAGRGSEAPASHRSARRSLRRAE